MAIRGAKPPGDQGPTSWGRVDAEAGKSWDAFVAGDAIAIDGHFVGRTVPCLRRYYGPAVACEGCAKPVPVDLVYYLPLYRGTDYKPVFVILHKDQQDSLGRLRLHQCVTVGRTNEEMTGLYVCPSLKQPKFETSLAWKKQTANLALYLPTVWRMRGVIDADTVLRGPLRCVSDTAVSLGDERDAAILSPDRERELSAAVVGQQFTPVGTDSPPPLAGDLADVFRRRGITTTPKKNGTH